MYERCSHSLFQDGAKESDVVICNSLAGEGVDHPNAMPLWPYHWPGKAWIILTPCPYDPITGRGRRGSY